MSGVITGMINKLITELLKHEVRRHQMGIDKIILQNSVVGNFLHKGKTYKPSLAGLSRRIALDEKLWPDMDKLIQDIDKVARDSQRFWQILLTMLTPCQTQQEARDVLPDFLVGYLDAPIRDLPRVDEEAWTIKTNVRSMKQFTEARERMELYHLLQENPAIGPMMNFYHYEI